MLTEQQIEDQKEFERKQISGGLDRLHSNTTKLEEKTYASATVYGSACMSSILPDLISFIESKKDKYTKIGGGHSMQVFHNHILPNDSSIQAMLACKVVFDHVFPPTSKKHNLTSIARAVKVSRMTSFWLLCGGKSNFNHA